MALFSPKFFLFASLLLACFFVYNNVFKEDLSTRFHYLSVENKLKYEKCLKDYKENYCDKHEIPYLEDYCLQLKVCIQSFESYSFLKKDVITSRLQLLIKYLLIDNIDLLLKNYIYAAKDDNKTRQNGMFNILVVTIIAVLFFIVPLYIVVHSMKSLLTFKTEKDEAIKDSNKILSSENDDVVIEEKM